MTLPEPDLLTVHLAPPVTSTAPEPMQISDILSVEGDTLVVHSNVSSWGGYPGQDSGPVQVEVGTHDLSAAWLNGAGTLSIDRVKGLKFGLSVQGSGAGEIGNADVDQLDINVMARL